MTVEQITEKPRKDLDQAEWLVKMARWIQKTPRGLSMLNQDNPLMALALRIANMEGSFEATKRQYLRSRRILYTELEAGVREREPKPDPAETERRLTKKLVLADLPEFGEVRLDTLTKRLTGSDDENDRDRVRYMLKRLEQAGLVERPGRGAYRRRREAPK